MDFESLNRAAEAQRTPTASIEDRKAREEQQFKYRVEDLGSRISFAVERTARDALQHKGVLQRSFVDVSDLAQKWKFDDVNHLGWSHYMRYKLTPNICGEFRQKLPAFRVNITYDDKTTYESDDKGRTLKRIKLDRICIEITLEN